MDGTAIATAITAVGPDLEAIGAAVIGLAVIAMAVKWVKGMVLS
jgi:hypothetical protein